VVHPLNFHGQATTCVCVFSPDQRRVGPQATGCRRDTPGRWRHAPLPPLPPTAAPAPCGRGGGHVW